ncbi:MAG: patatin-like phospholipase family protein [Porticoccaceae bacterium]|nr:MAG: patatin-like phospholipase family protein [Porticoccaceae bacterium]
MKAGIWTVGVALLLSACGFSPYSHTNVERRDPAIEPSRATLHVTPERGRDDTLFVLALSGGGSRAAYWSANVMLALQTTFPDLDMLCEVDVISSVSGGSLPAAYYGISTDAKPCPGAVAQKGYGRGWDRAVVRRLMRKNYINKWFGNWFWPTNIAKYWVTSYDRTDIMAQTLADNLYDRRPTGQDLKIGDLLPDRPYLILNATNGTSDSFGKSFTFTAEDFSTIKSDINDYELGRAVMATATFPAVFSYMTLKNFDKDAYTHVFDGGNMDNLGLYGVSRMFDTMETPIPPRVIVILVDAYTGKSGVDSHDWDSRKVSDFIVDSNFLDSSDSLLAANREKTLGAFVAKLATLKDGDSARKSHTIFYHVKFEDIKDDELRKEVTNIPTNFKISRPDARVIDKVVARLMTPDNVCLAAIRDILSGGDYLGGDNPTCTYTK